jgi:hypothetical protein
MTLYSTVKAPGRGSDISPAGKKDVAISKNVAPIQVDHATVDGLIRKVVRGIADKKKPAGYPCGL